MATTTKPSKPTTFRIGEDQITALDIITETVELSRNSLVRLAISAFLDHVDRTGKLPVPKLQRKGKG
jgi:hypothetical protein